MTHIGRGRAAAARLVLLIIACCALWPLARQAAAPGAHAATRSPQSRVAARPANPGDDAIYAGDLSVPDHTVFNPGQRFVKIWRIRNIGTNPWTSGYRWHFEAGTQMSALNAVPVSYARPGATIAIGVPMTAPEATGVYTSFWQMTNTTGQIFGHQAWVSIVVRTAVRTRGGPLPSPTPTSAGLKFSTAVSPTATASPTPTQRAPIPVDVPPTIALPGGDGHMVASPWTGAATYRAYFPAGSTAGGMQEVLALYYPGSGVAHVRLTMYRPDAAFRQLLFALQAGARTTLSLNRIAPNTNLAVSIEADRPVLTERTLISGHGVLGNPGAARTARRWWFPGMGGNSAYDQQLIFFNPYDVPARATIAIGRSQGGCCARIITIDVPPLRQFTYDLGVSAAFAGPLSISASSVVAVERLMLAAAGSTISDLPGAANLAGTWYLPDARSGPDGSAVVVFNPGATTLMATVRLGLDRGPGRWLKQSIAPFSQLVVPVGGWTVSPAFGVIVTATGPVVASLLLHTGSTQPSFYLGSANAGRSWIVVGSTAGRGSSQTLAVLNPNAMTCTVFFTIVHGKSKGATWQIRVPADGRVARIVDGLVAADGGIITIQASEPIAVGRTLESSSGTATSLGLATASDNVG